MVGTLMLLAAASWVTVMSLAGSSWKAISAADAAYASKLYTPPLDQVLYRLGPVNSWVLFRHKPPTAMARRIFALRVAVLVQVTLTVGFCVSLFWQIAGIL